jgi:lipopolysaccharide transport system permease protein
MDEAGMIPKAAQTERPLERVIDARRPWRLVDLDELWRYREVIYFLVLRDLKLKYRQTFLGIGWTAIQPLIGLGVFSFVFGKLVGVGTGGVPYPLFVICGLVPWSYFSRAVAYTTTCLTANPELVRKVYFPRIALPLAASLAFVGDLAIGFCVMAALLLVYLTPPTPEIVLLPLFLVLLLATALGLGLFGAATNAKYRDVGHMLPFLVQTMLFLTPVVYPSSLVPDVLKLVYALNPLVGVIDGIRWCMLGTPLDGAMLAVSVLSATVCFFVGLAWFSSREATFADVI